MKTVAIVGGGFCGTVLAAHLLGRSEDPIRVCLFDRSGVFGAGIAYGTDEPHHFLNVPASKMSAFEDQPNHLLEWLSSQDIEPRDGFLPRRIYRRYLQDLLEQPPRNPNSELRLHAEAVVALDEGARLRTSSERFYWPDEVVLATGYLADTQFDAQPPFDPALWPSRVAHAIVIGSGLTALDAAATILARYPNARVTLLSRQGRISEPFTAAPPYTVSGQPPKTVRKIVRWLRNEIERAESWTAVFDAMRPRWDDLWRALPDEERRRFLRHFRPIFDRHRHRIPPGQAAALAPFRASGQLSICRAEAVSATPSEVILRDGATLDADLVVDASGFRCDWNRSGDALTSQLLASGQVRPGSLGMGISADASGRVGDHLYALGPPLRGLRWETTAVPELRRQVREICSAILEGT